VKKTLAVEAELLRREGIDLAGPTFPTTKQTTKSTPNVGFIPTR
jgi:hypothetical protein